MIPLAAMPPPNALLTEVRWGWTWSPWVTGLVAAAAIVWVVVIYLREQPFVRLSVRMGLAVLRIAASTIVLVMLAQPTIERRRVAPPRLVLLVDRSASMGTQDVTAAELPQASSATGVISRREAWQSILSGGSRPLLDELRGRYDVDIVEFDTEFELLEGETLADDVSADPTESGSEDASEGRGGTRLGDALDFALRQLEGPRPAAVIAFTDGVNTEGLPLAEAAARARTLGVPIYAVALGSDRPRPDVSIDDVVVEQVVFPGDRLQVEATVRATGYAGRTARVVLKQAEGEGVFAKTQAELLADGEAQTVRLALRPTEPGALRLRLEVDVQPGEQDGANNRVELTVDVREQRIRTLLVQSTPSYEYRALKSLLERDPAIDLRVRLQDADAEYPSVDDVAIQEFPTSDAELQEYDVVLLGDVDPQLMPGSAWQNLRQWVTRHGGGLVLIAGPRYLPRRFEDVEAMRPLFPIELQSFNSLRTEADSTSGFAVQPTPLGSRESSLQLGETPEESAAIWRQLPPVMWIEPAEAKPGVQVLAEGRMSDGAVAEPLPVILRHYVGAGEVLMHATDETWRWRWRSDDRYFARYWGQAVRRLARGGVLRGMGSLATSRSEYQAGEPVVMRARLRPQEPVTDDAISVDLEAGSAPTRPVRFSRKGALGDVFEAVLRDLPPDHYTARLITGGASSAMLTAEFAVEAPPGELARLVVNTAGLQEAARSSDGKFYTARTVSRLADELPQAKPTAVEQLPEEPLWNRPWLLAALCVVLGAEWLLRRRSGML